MSSSSQNTPAPRKKRSAVYIVILVSIAAHLLAGGVLAVIKITEVLKKEAEFEAPILEAVRPPTPPPPPPPTALRTQKSMPRPQPLVAQNPQNLEVPSIQIDKTNLNMLSGRGFGGGIGTVGGGVIESLRTIKLFGTEVSTGGIGLVLDVSASAHDYLDKAIEEIDKHFSSEPMILSIGCGMSDGEQPLAHAGHAAQTPPGLPRVVSYRNRGADKQYDSLRRSVHTTLDYFFKTAARRGEDGDDLRKYFDRRDNLYMLYGGDVFAANFAFEFLIEKNVDTIYFFADFADKIDDAAIEDLTKKLKKARVKVIAHNFAGRPVPDKVKAMVLQTGGQTIEVVPGQQ
jgi:hypothetical protein